MRTVKSSIDQVRIIQDGIHNYIGIRSIKTSGRGQVIDLSCKTKPFTFIANGFLVHNCYVTADKWQQWDDKVDENRYGMEGYLRNNSIEYAMRLLEHLCKKYPEIKVFNLDDELPISIEMHKGNKYNWWLDFCRQYKTRIYDEFGVTFCCNSRINLMNEEIIKAMVEAGCRECRMGFESGSYRIRKDILDKPITDENMREIYRLCDLYGLRTSSFTMIGIPDEKEEDIWATINMTAELKPFLIRLTFCYPFENTKLWFYAKKNNLIQEDKLYKQHGYFEETVFKLPVDDQKLMAFRFLFPWFVNYIMFESGKEKKLYGAAIEAYKKVDFRDQNILTAIIEHDKILSDLMGNMAHFCYFKNNTAYFHCKNKKYPRGVKPID